MAIILDHLKAIGNCFVGSKTYISVFIHAKSYPSAIASHLSVTQTSHSEVILHDIGTYILVSKIEQLSARHFLVFVVIAAVYH